MRLTRQTAISHILDFILRTRDFLIFFFLMFLYLERECAQTHVSREKAEREEESESQAGSMLSVQSLMQV